jgi:hypothetical protein
MPVYAEWDDEAQTIIRIHLHDPWTMNEYIEASSHVRTLMLSVSYPVHVIVDLTEMVSFPKDLLSGAPTINSHLLPNQGLMVGVKYSPYIRAIAKVVSRVFPRLTKNLHFVHTLAEAREYIAKHGKTSFQH